MNDIKRLFKRDCFYWLMAAVIIFLLGVTTHLALRTIGLRLNEIGGNFYDLFYNLSYDIMKLLTTPWILWTAFAVQALKLLIQETKNRAEVINLFPIKSRNILTYHYISGLLIVGAAILTPALIIRRHCISMEIRTGIAFEDADILWSYVTKAVIIFMLFYSLLILCRRLTNHVAGTVFTFILFKLVMEILAGRYLGMYWDNMADERIQNWLFWAALAAVFILLSYITEEKKDYAMGGFYAFPVVHWLVMGIIFVGTCCIFYDLCGDIPRISAWSLIITAALLITAAVDYIVKAK
ncbi:MAG: hypothetical protein NC433_15230 [Clostridiales bacterium]|nr:hypothetical protein [Clostridiales bacterium]